ncbi:hypothetical protein FQN54_004590 [Arachnomyces sp. PD_36]|nr:hypothetical protein FQN54_004590 [Arachnomyces sp. PD_36]
MPELAGWSDAPPTYDSLGFDESRPKGKKLKDGVQNFFKFCGGNVKGMKGRFETPVGQIPETRPPTPSVTRDFYNPTSHEKTYARIGKPGDNVPGTPRATIRGIAHNEHKDAVIRMDAKYQSLEGDIKTIASNIKEMTELLKPVVFILLLEAPARVPPVPSITNDFYNRDNQDLRMLMQSQRINIKDLSTDLKDVASAIRRAVEMVNNNQE